MTRHTHWMLIVAIAGSMITTSSTSFAKNILCKGESDCKAKILAARNTEGDDAGAVCFAPNVERIPKPAEGWPSECKAEFKCGEDRMIVMRAYFKDLAYYQKWIKSDGSTGAGALFGSCLWSDQFANYCVGYQPWAYKPESTSIYYQMEQIMGTSDDTYLGRMNPNEFCASGKGSLDYYLKVYASRVRLSKDYVTHMVGDRLVTEREELTDEKFAARGEFKLTK